MTSRYDVEVDPDTPNNPHAAAIRLVGSGKRVLEVGCAGGHVTRHLVARGNEVVGIEIDAGAADHAREYAAEVHVADIDLVAPSSLVSGPFDVALLGDVLEHLRHPERVLADVAGLLTDDGELVVSLPHVAHSDVRAMLLFGDWVYQDVGLLDRTHLRWFTRASVRELLASVGFTAVEVERIKVGWRASYLPFDAELVPTDVQRLIRADPESDTFQFVVRAVRSRPDLTDALAVPEPVDWPDLDAEREARQARIRQLEEQVDALEDQNRALTNEVDAWRRSRIVRYSQPLRRVANRGRALVAKLTGR